MPIVTTMTLMALLRDSDGSPCPFFEPGLLREQLENGLREHEPELARALVVADELDALLERYSASVHATLDAYIEKTTQPETRAADLIEQIRPMDEERARAMREIIHGRQQLVDLLSGDQWSRVFS